MTRRETLAMTETTRTVRTGAPPTRRDRHIDALEVRRVTLDSTRRDARWMRKGLYDVVVRAARGARDATRVGGTVTVGSG